MNKNTIFFSKCSRCMKKAEMLIMSWFNKQMICSRCREIELKHPMINKAKDKELQECKKGNYNFDGIGLPEDLR